MLGGNRERIMEDHINILSKNNKSLLFLKLKGEKLYETEILLIRLLKEKEM